MIRNMLLHVLEFVSPVLSDEQVLALYKRIPESKIYRDKDGNAYVCKAGAKRPFRFDEASAVKEAGYNHLETTYGWKPEFHEKLIWVNSHGHGINYDWKKKKATFMIYYDKDGGPVSEAKHFFNRPHLTEFTYEYEGKTLPAEFRYELREIARLC